MQKNLFLIFGIVLLIIDFLFIGFVRYGDNSTELFIKHKPCLIFNFSPEDGPAYKEFVSNYHIDDEGRSLVPLFLIQLMLSCFALSLVKTDIRRKLALFAFHFVLCFIGSFQFIILATEQTNKFIAVVILIVMIVLEYLFLKLFAPKKVNALQA